jgi:DNA-binding transcriptional regulator YiaG
VFPQAYRNRRSRWLHVSTPLVTRWEHEGAPEPVLLLATALFEGIVRQKTLPSPDLAALRQKLGLRQEDMAKKFGRRLAAYGEWELAGKCQMGGGLRRSCADVAGMKGGAMLASADQPTQIASPTSESSSSQLN